MRWFILIILILFYAVRAFCQFEDPYNFSFKTYTTDNGLVHNYARKCLSDSKGFLWIITQNGLSRFDGFTFRNFQHKTEDSLSLPNNDLVDMAIDSKDRVWLAYSTGVCYFDPKTNGFYQIKDSKKDLRVINLCYDLAGDAVWMVSPKGLLKVSCKTLFINNADLGRVIPSTPSSIMIDSKRRLWITYFRFGYFVYDTRTGKSEYTDKAFWPMAVNEDSESNIWISTWEDGFQAVDKNAIQPYANYNLPKDAESGYGYIFKGVIEAPKLTGKNILWIVATAGGIVLFDKKLKKIVKWIRYDPQEKTGLTTDDNEYIYESPDGTIWICTWFGLTKVNKGEQLFISRELRELKFNVYNLLFGLADDSHEKGITWISVHGTGIARFDNSLQKVTKWYYRTSPDKTKDIYDPQRWTVGWVKDRDSVLWTASIGGFLEVNRGKVTYHEVKTPAGNTMYTQQIHNFNDQYVWLSGFRGLARIDPKTHHYETYELPEDWIKQTYERSRYTAAVDSPGDSAFYATWSGLFSFHKTRKTFSKIPYSHPSFDSAAWESCTALERIGNKLYIGTQAGLLEMDIVTHKSAIIGRQQGIFRVSRWAIRKDKANNLWIYTSNGLFRYDPVNKGFRLFTMSDKLYSTTEDEGALFTYNDKMFIGYRMAYTSFDPLAVNLNSSIPQPFITALRINEAEQRLDPSEYINKIFPLNYEQNHVAFDFTAIEYNTPQKLLFEYRLQNFDKDWKKATTHRSVQYTNLPEGNYTFLVKATNSAGLKNDSPVQFQFSISPPWQRTWWFRGLMILIVGSILYALFRFRINKIRKTEEQKTAINKGMADLEMKALRSQMNPHFIFNSLNSIQKYIWENRKEDASEYLIKFARLIRLVLENSLHSSIKLSEELAALRLYIEMEHRRNNQKFDYSITIDDKVDEDKTYISPLLLQPYVENAIWHGLSQKEERGKLSIAIEKNENALICIIDDDGIGRTSADEIKINKLNKISLGTNISSQRIEWLQKDAGLRADVEITDKYDGKNASGTKVVLTLPLIVKHD
jgi:ligand-binding sensor domain-containing protein